MSEQKLISFKEAVIISFKKIPKEKYNRVYELAGYSQQGFGHIAKGERLDNTGKLIYKKSFDAIKIVAKEIEDDMRFIQTLKIQE